MTREDLFFKQKNIYETADEGTVAAIYDFAEGYKRFLDVSRTRVHTPCQQR